MGCARPGAPAGRLRAPASLPASSPALTFPTEVDVPTIETPNASVTAQCVSASPKVESGGAQIFEFAPIDIRPVDFGPRITDMPRSGRPRSEIGMARQIAAHVPSIHECYRWAHFNSPSLHGPMKIHFDINPLGSIDSFVVEDAKRWGELAVCVEEVMRSGMQANSFTPRKTAINAVLDFEPSGQARPPVRPPRPQVSEAPKRGGCVAARSPITVDVIAMDTAFAIDDFDPVMAEMERQRALCRSEGSLHCHFTRPINDYGMYTVASLGAHRSDYIIRKYLDFNGGAFSACWRAAHTDAVEPPIVTLLATIPADGRIGKAVVETSTSGNPGLDECLRSALADIWFPGAPAAASTIIHVPLRLIPAAPPPAIPARDTVTNIGGYARAALDMGDGYSALRRYAALLGHVPACEARLGMLRAQITLHPWIDETVMSAARQLVEDAKTGPCSDAAMLEIVHLAHSAHRMGDALRSPELLELAVERYKLALRFPAGALGDDVRANLADAFGKLGQEDQVKAWLPKDHSPVMPQAD